MNQKDINIISSDFDYFQYSENQLKDYAKKLTKGKDAKNLNNQNDKNDKKIKEAEELNIRLQIINNGTASILNIGNILKIVNLDKAEMDSLKIAKKKILQQLQKLEEFQEDKKETEESYWTTSHQW